jgi:hypothetical protein
MRARQASRLHIEDPYELERNIHGFVEEAQLHEVFKRALKSVESGTTPVGLSTRAAEPEEVTPKVIASEHSGTKSTSTLSTMSGSSVRSGTSDDEIGRESGTDERRSTNAAVLQEVPEQQQAPPSAGGMQQWWLRMDQPDVAEALNSLAPGVEPARVEIAPLVEKQSATPALRAAAAFSGYSVAATTVAYAAQANRTASSMAESKPEAARPVVGCAALWKQRFAARTTSKIAAKMEKALLAQ